MTIESRTTTGPPTQDADQILATLVALVEPLSRTLPSDCEVVLHDLRRLPNSIVAITGDMTGRSVGGPATDLLLRKASTGTIATTVGYETRLPDGRSLRSTTVVFRDAQDTAVAALCINSDVMIWQAVKAIAESMLPAEAPAQPDRPASRHAVSHLPGINRSLNLSGRRRIAPHGAACDSSNITIRRQSTGFPQRLGVGVTQN